MGQCLFPQITFPRPKNPTPSLCGAGWVGQPRLRRDGRICGSLRLAALPGPGLVAQSELFFLLFFSLPSPPRAAPRLLLLAIDLSRAFFPVNYNVSMRQSLIDLSRARLLPGTSRYFLYLSCQMLLVINFKYLLIENARCFWWPRARPTSTMAII